MARVKKRVLFLAPYLGDGGINTHMLTLGKELKKLGWDVAICSGGSLGEVAKDAPIPEDYEEAGIPHFRAWIPASPHRLRDLPQLLQLPIAMWQVIRAVRQFRPALLHSHSRQMGAYARVVQLLVGVPFISTVHNPIKPRNRLWARTTFLGSEAVAVGGEIQAGLIRDYGVDPDRVRVVAPGADAEHLRPPTRDERDVARRRWGIQPGQFVLAFVGSLNANKRPDTLVDAVAALGATQHDVVALVAGQGPDEEALRARAGSLGIAPRVQLLGYQDARSVLWAADALVLPSEVEGFGLVVVEAMLCGVPVLCTPAAAAQKVTPDVTGVVFDVGDDEGLAQRVRQMIEQPDVRGAMAARALDDARNRFSSTQMARSIEETYLRALEP